MRHRDAVLTKVALSLGLTAAVVIAFTSNGLSVDLQFLFATAAAIGTVEEHKFESALPLKSAAAGAAVSFLVPATTSVIWAVNFSYYFGS